MAVQGMLRIAASRSRLLIAFATLVVTFGQDGEDFPPAPPPPPPLPSSEAGQDTKALQALLTQVTDELREQLKKLEATVEGQATQILALEQKLTSTVASAAAHADETQKAMTVMNAEVCSKKEFDSFKETTQTAVRCYRRDHQGAGSPEAGRI